MYFSMCYFQTVQNIQKEAPTTNYNKIPRSRHTLCGHLLSIASSTPHKNIKWCPLELNFKPVIIYHNLAIGAVCENLRGEALLKAVRMQCNDSWIEHSQGVKVADIFAEFQTRACKAPQV